MEWYPRTEKPKETHSFARAGGDDLPRLSLGLGYALWIIFVRDEAEMRWLERFGSEWCELFLIFELLVLAGLYWDNMIIQESRMVVGGVNEQVRGVNEEARMRGRCH